MPSGKPRPHRRNLGGRPSNKERETAREAEILRLRRLVTRRHHADATWHAIDILLTVIEELEDLATPQRSTVWDSTGHTVEAPILPGVHITTDGKIVHAGTYADRLGTWLLRTVVWSSRSAERKLTGREPDPKPRPPRREENMSVTGTDQ